jgi:hypothetical protein
LWVCQYNTPPATAKISTKMKVDNINLPLEIDLFFFNPVCIVFISPEKTITVP